MIVPKAAIKNLFRVTPSARLGFLRLDMNESLDGLPEDFLRSCLAELTPEFFAKYPEYELLTQKIAAHEGIGAENISLSNGSNSSIKYLFDAYISPGDKILLADPCYAMYSVYSEIFGAIPKKIEYLPNLEFPTDAFLAQISSSVRLAVIVNPNNPTGTIVAEENLLEIISKAEKNDVLVIVDECYFHYYGKSVIKRVQDFKNLIVLRTFSKLCGIAACRIGFAAANQEIIKNLKRVKPTYDVSGLGVFLATKILDDPLVTKAMLQTTNQGKEFLIKKLEASRIQYKTSNANFVLIHCGSKASEVKQQLEDLKILVGGGFKHEFLQPFIRVAVGGISAMEKFWEAFRNLI